MKGFQARYESIDSMLLNIEQIIDYVETNERLPSTVPATSQPFSGHFWLKTLLTRPQTFIRIAMTINFCLSRGHSPTDTDFPEALRIGRQWDYGNCLAHLAETTESALWMRLREVMDVGLDA
ncbi:unnamed protein product [Clonostachys rosea]|uniref:Uncharacterized protein n=1 Tax=Bionectria ochroleuca TaxID=29856 RepID=A0ABY6TYX2_BIOOC|nr:unnamed protein product [Clonostachys rosea]